MSDSDDEIPTQGYWPSVTDLFLTLFVIAIAIVAVVFCALLPTNNVGRDRALIQAVGNDLLNIRAPMNRLRATLELEPVGAQAAPTKVVEALAETCDLAVAKIELLQKQVGELDDRLARLMGSGSQREEMERLLHENTGLQRKIQELEQQMAKLIRTFGSDPEALTKILRENDDLRRQLHDKPPNIQISEQKEDYRFESGSSAMGTKFIQGLASNEFVRLAEEIIGREEEGRVKVDTLEIIGHTDGVPLSRSGNLDMKLPEVLAESGPTISSLTPGSNNDLGLLRALAVREQWAHYVESHEERHILRKIHIRCYSAGQTILPDHTEKLSSEAYRRNDPSARRIEMRLTRLNDDPASPPKTPQE